ncbi:hypothetical protein C8Q73DRAFT_707884 [Cubamyces lactineus]|nr:hypothetical protein C8Q73DRAFT_707884 [Cubamyces lactineus]
MDAKALSQLSSAELKKIAQREGIRANQSKKDIISALIAKYHPVLVPYPADLTASSPTSASSQIARKQGEAGNLQNQRVSASTSASVTHSSNRRRQEPSARKVAPIYRPTVRELQEALDFVAPIANEEMETKEQVRELQLLVSSIARRTAKLREKALRLQQLRLAFERHLPELEELRPQRAATAASRPEESKDEEEELIEVEEMTSREVDFTDLPSTPNGDVDMAEYVLGFICRDNL